MLYGDYTIRGYYTMENVFLPLFPGRFLQVGIKLQGQGGKVAKNEAGKPAGERRIPGFCLKNGDLQWLQN